MSEKRAFPAFGEPFTGQSHGMTLREWYAGLAMQSLMIPPRSFEDYMTADEICRRAFSMANRMIIEAEKRAEK